MYVYHEDLKTLVGRPTKILSHLTVNDVVLLSVMFFQYNRSAMMRKIDIFCPHHAVEWAVVIHEDLSWSDKNQSHGTVSPAYQSCLLFSPSFSYLITFPRHITHCVVIAKMD